MEPVSLAAAILAIASKCLTLTKDLSDVRTKFGFASLTIVAICTESSVCSSALFRLQTLLVYRQAQSPGASTGVDNLIEQPLFLSSCDAALTGCALIMSCLDDELKDLRRSAEQGSEFKWTQKARAVWKEQTMQDLLQQLRGQVTALNLLLQCTQMETSIQTNELLVSQIGAIDRVRSDIHALRANYPENKTPESVLSSTRSIDEIFNDASSTVGNQEFDFDDEIVTAKAYRRVLAAAKNRRQSPQQEEFQEDMIVESRYQKDRGGSGEMQPQFQTVGSAATVLATDTDVNIKANTISDRDDQHFSMPLVPTRLEDKTNRLAIESGSEPNAGANKNLQDVKFTRFGLYILGQTIGQGNAKVKYAWHKDSRAEVAIKLVRTRQRNGNELNIDQKIDEVKMLCGIRHPNIVGYHEYVITKLFFGIVTEYVSGGTLAEYMDHHRYLKDASARRFFAQIISGLGYLHKKKIAHLSLSSTNILLDRNRNVVIAGFSSVANFEPLVGDDLDRGLRHAAIEPSITVPYTAPEFIVPTTLSYPLADIWSCGIVLYKILSGLTPFHGVTQDIVSPEKQYTVVISTPLTFPEYVTPHARDLLRRLIVPDPRRRADLLEVARHSWLSDCSHVVGFIIAKRDTD